MISDTTEWFDGVLNVFLLEELFINTEYLLELTFKRNDIYSTDSFKMVYITSTLFSLFADCGAIYSIENGNLNFTGRETVFNSSVPVLCDIGYEIYRESEITCLSDGTWSRNTTCRIKGMHCRKVVHKNIIKNWIEINVCDFKLSVIHFFKLFLYVHYDCHECILFIINSRWLTYC